MIKQLVVILTSVGLLLGCGPNKDFEDGGPAVTKMGELKEKICACTTSECVKELATKDVKNDLLKGLANSSDADKKAFKVIGKATDACIAGIKKKEAAKKKSTEEGAKKTDAQEGNNAAKPEPSAKPNNPAATPKTTDKKADSNTPSAKPKTEIPALKFHVERHKLTCACKKMTGSLKGECLKKLKDWESKHTIQADREKATKEELAARGKKIAEALSQIPCDGPDSGIQKPSFKVVPGAKLTPVTKTDAKAAPGKTKSPQAPNGAKTAK